MIKKILKYLSAFLTAAVVLFIFYNFIGGAICNDIKASRIEKTYASMELPENTELIETASFVGNTSGTGNHTEIWAGALIYSELSEAEVTAFFSDYYISTLTDDGKTADSQASSFFSQDGYFDRFPVLETLDSKTGCYVISNYYDAFTQADLRGH